MTKQEWYSEWKSVNKLLEQMVAKGDKIAYDYNQLHDKFTNLRANGKNPDVNFYRDKLWQLKNDGLENYKSSLTLMRGRYQTVSDALRDKDPNNFQPDGWLIKHDHIADTYFKGLRPIDLIHAAPKPAKVATTNTDVGFVVNDSPFSQLFSPNNEIPPIQELLELQNGVMFYSTILLIGLGWLLLSLLIKFAGPYISNKYINHSRLINSILNIAPALILILIALPVFTLLMVGVI